MTQAQTDSQRRLTVDLKTGRTITFEVPSANGVDSNPVFVTITHEFKAGRLARLSVAAPATVKIGLP